MSAGLWLAVWAVGITVWVVASWKFATWLAYKLVPCRGSGYDDDC